MPRLLVRAIAAMALTLPAVAQPEPRLPTCPEGPLFDTPADRARGLPGLPAARIPLFAHTHLPGQAFELHFRRARPAGAGADRPFPPAVSG